MDSQILFKQITHDYIDQALRLIDDVFYYTPAVDRWDEEDLEELIDVFPEGTILAIDLQSEKLVGIGLGIFVELDLNNLPDKEDEIIYQDRIMHDPLGSYYLGIDLAVSPQFRGKRIARTIYDYRKAVIIKNNKRGFVAAATIPGYENEKQRMTHHTYIERVINEEIFDPTLSVQLRNGFKVLRSLKNFFYHEETNHCSALIYWENKQYIGS